MNLKKPYYLEKVSEAGGRPLLCLHGLNQRPQALKPLLGDLESLGFSSYLMHLPGHNGEEKYDQLTAQTYYDAYKKAYDYVVTKYDKKPYFLGYSFGGLIGTHYHDHCPFEKMILLAPALQMRAYTFLIRSTLPFLNRVTSISLGHDEYEKKYRYHSQGVPKQIYQSFFSIYDENQKKEKSYLKESKAFVLSHRSDELVSYKKLKSWVGKNTSWKFAKIENKEAEFRRYNHLCFDPTTLGHQSYRELVQKLNDYLVG